jgi:hypothetical protein
VAAEIAQKLRRMRLLFVKSIGRRGMSSRGTVQGVSKLLGFYLKAFLERNVWFDRCRGFYRGVAARGARQSVSCSRLLFACQCFIIIPVVFVAHILSAPRRRCLQICSPAAIASASSFKCGGVLGRLAVYFVHERAAA